MSFTSIGVPADITAYLAEREILSPYPVQEATLPDALAGLDVCAQSPTGSGKTLAFGIPLCVRAARGRPQRPSALVLAPTRELAAQIATELEGIAALRKRRIATFYGGVGFNKQLEALRKGVDIAVACPGRLLDLMQQGSANLTEVGLVVVDEADRMADMGFLPTVRKIIEQTSPERQTLLFSATLGGDVEQLIRGFQRSPKRHVLDMPSDEVGSRLHRFVRTTASGRASTTASIVAEHASAIIFCRTKRGVDRLAKQLAASGISTAALHGDRSQAQRDRALAAFHARHVQVLVGTDVAARGIHVDDVGCVVHFDPPEDESTYVHRSGRTGRAGASGLVVSLVTDEQEAASRKLQTVLGMPVSFDGPGEAAGQLRPDQIGSSQRPTSQRTGGSGRGGQGGAAPRQGGQRPTGQRQGARRQGGQGQARAPRSEGQRDRVGGERRAEQPQRQRSAAASARPQRAGFNTGNSNTSRPPTRGPRRRPTAA